jgi:hypothetical protein
MGGTVGRGYAKANLGALHELGPLVATIDRAPSRDGDRADPSSRHGRPVRPVRNYSAT